MLSEREFAVERVLNDLRTLLLDRGVASCACGRDGKYKLASGDTSNVLARLARARAYCEVATDNADRALEQIELMQRGMT